MTNFPFEIWVLIACVSGAGVLTMLHVLATMFAHERGMCDLRSRVGELRKVYAKRIADLAARTNGPALEVDELPSEAEHRRNAA